MFPIRTILVPTDYAEHSRLAFRLACSLAAVHGARLVVLYVWAPPVCYGEGAARRQPNSWEDELWRRLCRLRPEGAQVEMEHRLGEGDAAEEILRVAREEPCDLIVMGTQGRTGLGRLLMGSTAERVMRGAPCGVLTVKAPPAVPAASARSARGRAAGPTAPDALPYGAAARACVGRLSARTASSRLA